MNDVPMDQWAPEEIDAHIQYMEDFATRLGGTEEFIDAQALAEDGLWLRSGGPGRPPVTDGPFAETKDLIAGWMVIDVDSQQRAIELAGELSAAPGGNGEPVGGWLELRPFLTERPGAATGWESSRRRPPSRRFMRMRPAAGLAVLEELDPGIPRHAAAAAYLHAGRPDRPGR